MEDRKGIREMARFIKKVGLYSIYSLDVKECKQHFREFPTLVCWLSTHHEDIGNMSLTENETESINEMEEWCKEQSTGCWFQDANIGGYFDRNGNLIVCEEYGTEEDFDSHAVEVMNGDGYYNENGKYISYN